MSDLRMGLHRKMSESNCEKIVIAKAKYVKPIWQKNFLFTLSVCFLACLFTLTKGSWPEIYWFATNEDLSQIKRLITSPVHLTDDVMISLRAGYILNELGFPAFNRADIAQPSTSYMSPYLFAVLLKLFPQNIAVCIYAGLGFFAVILTFAIISFYAKSKKNALLLVIALCLTTTNTEYALNGWDHLFQAFFFTFAAVLSLQGKDSWWSLITCAIFLVLGLLFRPDGVLIAGAILLAVYLRGYSLKNLILFGLLPFCTIIAGCLLLNLSYFGYLTPTTARLKVGDSPSLLYSLSYFSQNTLLSYTASSVFIVCLIFFITYRKKFADNSSNAIVIGCFLTCVIAFYNSDVFSGGRMVWTSACVMSALIAISAPSVLCLDSESLRNIFSISSVYQQRLSERAIIRVKRLAIILVSLAIFATFTKNLRDKLSASLIRDATIYNSLTAQQFRIAKWVERNLRPIDGSIGFFFLGVGYHLPSFEIADFLGKADELIASLPVKWGPPGHNKWDIDKSLDKWKPQAIVPPRNADFSLEKAVERAQTDVKKRTVNFAAVLMLNKRIRENYSYCYILNKKDNTMSPDNWGLLLRKDIVRKLSKQNNLKCTPYDNHSGTLSHH